ncbi:hypothetical protein QQ008_29495 [Fulvivirgaceae bacterium BMA10]|uniref:WD40 repeat protein n=1 Tax=Splendidivirga corallicola TaxID=3051826 RepID=A0ABT8KXP1_9BACT|nr:hypothetical protein [Fulvivirgaceae bacterium BMA10]
MKHIRSLLIILTATVVWSCIGVDESLKYLGQQPPGAIPEIFAPDLISKKTEHEFGSFFSKDGTEFFYAVDIDGKAEIRYCNLENSSWTNPRTIISHKNYGYNDPFLSPNENELYYISNMPANDHTDIPNHDIWYSIREQNGWSKPINAGNHINSIYNEYYISFTIDGTMFFSSNVALEENGWRNFDIYASKNLNGIFQKPYKLNDSINSTDYEADVFIAPNESYMIFCSIREDGFGQGDLYISFKKDDNNWTTAKNMGATINTKHHELCPVVTRDGKYFFFTSNQDIYWVDAKVIEKYR